MARSRFIIPAVCLSLALGAGLFTPAHTHAQRAKTSDGRPLPASLLLSALPADASEVADAVKAARPGQPITLRGRIAMAKDAFAGGESFILSDDAAVASCCPKTGALMDTCTFGGSHKATIRVPGAGGSLEGRSGLKHGAEVFIVGTVESANGSDALAVKATGIHIPEQGLPAGFFTQQAPADAKDVTEAKKAGPMKKGDKVVLRGVVGGSRDPFVPKRAMFTLMGAGLKPCSANPEDKCKTPWDYCCETRADIAANSATIRVTDDKGGILRTEMKGRMAGGVAIRELSEVIVVGTVAVADKGVLVVDATAIHPVKP